MEPLSNVPRRFGDYELVEEIARGGMGIVFRARQISLNRFVAVKMILSGEFAGVSELARFRAEAETVAQLQHPNIVAIHEVGEHEGQPYFSMDYVVGQNLAQVVGSTPLPAQRAARYLLDIARAVHFAHQRGVLHRDLKPSNVLIDENDQPRITDFGLAKKLEGDASLTLTGQVIGSPSFMPPEQAAMRNDVVGPASDVYSLGAILYHSLTGRPPFQARTLTATLRLVAEGEPAAPRLFNPDVPVDLETICLKCLEKEPSRRYASAREVADDLGRFLNHQPIHAAPPSAIYRARKFVRRHRVGVAVAAGFALVLMAATIVSTTFGWRANQAKEKEETERKRATRAEDAANQRAREALESQAESKAVLDYFKDHILTAIRPELEELGMGHDVTLRAALEAAVSAIPVTFTNLPLVEAEVRRTLGKSFLDLGDYAKAIEQTERALELITRVRGPNAARALVTRDQLAAAYLKADRLPEAEAMSRGTLELRRALDGQKNAATIQCLLGLADVQHKMEKHSLALTNYLKAAELSREALGSNDLVTLRALGGLAGGYHSLKLYEKALGLQLEVVRERLAAMGPTNSLTLVAQANLAATLQDMGRWKTAIAVHLDILKIKEAKLEPDHPSLLGSLHNLGVAYAFDRQYTNAVAILTKTTTLRAQRLGAGHRDTLASSNNLALLLLSMRRLSEAILLASNALHRARAQDGENGETTIEALAQLGSAYRGAGEFSNALQCFEQAVVAATRRFGSDDPRTANHLERLARTYLHFSTRYAEAEARFMELVAARRQSKAADKAPLATALGELGLTRLRLGKFAEAETVLREAVPIYENNQPNRTSTFSLYSQLGWSLLEQRKFEDAETWLLKAHDGFTKRDTENPSPASAHYGAETIKRLAQLYDARGNPDEAARWRKKAE